MFLKTTRRGRVVDETLLWQMWKKDIDQQEKRKSINVQAVHISECVFLNDAPLAFEANL
jgi:hypothetical protein